MRFLAILAIIFLSACSLLPKQAEDPPCPQTGFIAHTDKASFARAEVIINGFTGGCSFTKNGTAEVHLTIPFAAKRKDSAPEAAGIEPAYFIAVLSPEESILQRKSFSTNIRFDAAGVGNSVEERVIIVPLPSPKEAYKYKIVIGLALTPEQLRQNRERK